MLYILFITYKITHIMLPVKFIDYFMTIITVVRFAKHFNILFFTLPIFLNITYNNLLLNI